MPLISVIVPVYKVEAYLHRCVVSILAQTFSDFELILIDDGSPDNCPAMCDEYAKQDPRVVVIHQKNGGLSAARNAGIDWVFANSDGDWLTFIDSDDWVHPEYLERLYIAAVENAVSVSVCGFERTEGDEPTVREDQKIPRIQSPEDFYISDRVTAIIACAKLYKKSLFQLVRFPVGKIHEDEFVTHRVLFVEQRVVVIEAPLYAYFQNGSGIMASTNLKEQKHALEAMAAQAIFFKQNEFEKAYNFCVERNLYMLVGKYYAEKQSANNRAVLKQIQRFLRKFLHEHRLSPSEYTLEYKLAYPGGIEAYWFLKMIMRKLKK